MSLNVMINSQTVITDSINDVSPES